MPNYSYIDENLILSFFEKGDFPSQEQFAASWTSYWHKSATIPQSSIENLSLTLQGFADKTQFETHLQDADAHSNSLVKLDASNITALYREQLRNALGVGDIPDNVALVDIGQNQQVYNKTQIENLCLMLADFVTAGKIRADKIEALGLTEIHEVTETTLVAFAANSANYDFEINDIIAIPDGGGNYRLYIFKGGVKTATTNYLPTGLTNITIGMVEGLQSALDGKLNKPTGTGNFFARNNGVNTSWVQISPASYYLTLWNGSEFKESSIYDNSGKIGIGGTMATEMLHLFNGRIRTKAVVFDNNSEILPNQITLDGSHFWGAASNGVRRPFLFGDFEDYKNLWLSFSDSEKNQITTVANGGFTMNTMSISDIFPPILKLQNQNSQISIKGANLNLNPASFSVSICDFTSTADNPIVLDVVPNNQVTLISPTDFAFYYNFNQIGVGEYKLLIKNGLKSYLSTYTFLIKAQVDNIDLGSLVWNTKVLNDAVTNNMQAGGSGVLFRADAVVAPLADDPQSIFKAKTAQPIFLAGDDFYLEFNINFNNISGNNSSTFAFGISASSDYQTLINDLSHFVSMTLASNQFLTNTTGALGTFNLSQSVKVIMIKRGTYLLQQSNFSMNGMGFQQFTKIISDTNDWYFGSTFQNMNATNKTFNISIVSAYKF